MNRDLSFTIVGIVIILMLMIIGYSINNLETKCTCRHAVDGDYQIDLYDDSTVVRQGDRHVVTLKFDSTQALDKALIQDNE